MKLIVPNNIFTTLFLMSINKVDRKDIEIKEASLISSEVSKNESVIGLIPSFDLINNRDLYVSSKLGFGFESFLSNSYIYYSNQSEEISNILLRGDITTNEVILSKIVFQERYNLSVDVALDSEEKMNEMNNYLVVGNENWQNNYYLKGTSFCEHVSEIIDFPYMNFVFVSKNKDLMEEFNSKFSNVNKLVLSGLKNNLDQIGFDSELNDFIKCEIDSIYFDLTQNELDGLKELLQLAYYHKIIDDMFDVKFV